MVVRIDALAQLLICLTLFLVPVMFISSTKYDATTKKGSLFVLLVSILILGVCASMLSSSMLLFYVAFELRLLPLLVLILSWGYQVERLQAAMYLMIYTFVGSMPLLVALVVLRAELKTRAWFMFPLISSLPRNTINVFLVLAFIIKLPIYLFHL